MGCLKGGLQQSGVCSKGRREAAQKAGRWCKWVEDGAEAYMLK